MKIRTILPLAGLLYMLQACDPTDKDVFNVIPEETVWSNNQLALGALANLYQQLPAEAFSTQGMQITDEAMWGGIGDGMNTTTDIPTNTYEYWGYGFLRDIHLFIDKTNKATALKDDFKKQIVAEARFLRAYFYFEEVKRMGGVPLIKEVLNYNTIADIPNLQLPRAKEDEVYDFVIFELDAILPDLPPDAGIKGRASKWAALVLKCRAALYAGSIAKYNNLQPAPIKLPGGEVGIPAEKSKPYYQTALTAAQAIISGGVFAITTDYFSIFNQNKTNPEMIMAVLYSLPNKRHGFTADNSTPSARESSDGDAGRINPVFELANTYDNLDGTSTGLTLSNTDGDPLYFDNPQDLFANKDNRLAATILYGGQDFRGKRVDLQAGLARWNTTTSSYDIVSSPTLGAKSDDGYQITGFDGPNNLTSVSNSGLYIRKFMSTTLGAGQLSTLADNWWPLFRYAEVLLNAAEAAMELGQQEDAKTYINELRSKHGGITTPLTTLSWAKYVNERRIELAFEGHRYWDLKRWRTADAVLNGTNKLTGLYPYRVFRPGHPTHQKWFYKRVAPVRLTQAKRFIKENYYTFIPQGAINNNPKLVKNPGQ
ncbi:MAG TPA: RagB/SusD family nutrient uptake outer membrane protein [Chitinophaga sp.]|uniref:RagB/SusD family nutrient uptake outer membrane protein n=1 Tax=Chitinophaga sp. TaxID=1869181 RepID=UPI002C98AAAE|nr:RagB/SusD family nutrient uptake outer membrane protein [Chitinophaga sp.]HVI48989.1 RagB/SusD family nutrient uptake outer membrane protein [Chitinophaga sp.]